ncbi:MAG: hypothetical protein ACJAS1_003210 [Oleiphilaceae bacterium]|jgi:hypothetical protein
MATNRHSRAQGELRSKRERPGVGGNPLFYNEPQHHRFPPARGKRAKVSAIKPKVNLALSIRL